MEFISGIVLYNDGESVVVNNNGIGYRLLMKNSSLTKNKEALIYLHLDRKIECGSQIKEVWVGFETKEEREMFAQVLKIRGVGVKIAQKLLQLGIEVLGGLIMSGHDSDLSELACISKNLATNIIKQLQKNSEKQPLPCLMTKKIEIQIWFKKIYEYLREMGFESQEITNSIEKVQTQEIKPDCFNEAINLCISEINLYRNAGQ